MGKIVATYLVKVTVRETDGSPEPEDGKPAAAPTNDDLVESIERAIATDFPFEVNATSERTDR